MKNFRTRHAVQVLFLLFLTWVGYRHQVLGGGPKGAPTVDALCPFGGIESFYIYITSGGWLRRVAPSALILLTGVVVMTIATGRTFCSWICPLGTIGEFSGWVSGRLKMKKREFPEKIDSSLRYLKYAIFAIIIFFTWRMGTLVWRDFDPWVAYMHLSAGWSEVVEKPWSYVVFFGAVVLAALFIGRFWCRYLCPLGAMLAPLQKLSLIKVRRSEDFCIHCHKCSQACPVRIDPEASVTVKSAECISCGKCVESCPVENALFFFAGGKKLKILTAGIAGLMIFMGTWGIARATGIWQTWASPSQKVAESNPLEGVYGWMTVEEISQTLKITTKEVIEGGGLEPGTPLDVPLKKMDGVNDEEVKNSLGLYLESRGSRSVETGLPSPDEIRGSVTINEISEAYGLDGPSIIEKAGWPKDSSLSMPVKEIAREIGREVQQVRDAVKELLKEESR